MWVNIRNGIIAGLVAGLVFGVMMQMMTAPAPGGMRMPMMAMVAQVVGSASLLVGWVYHLFNSAVIGGIYGWLLGRKSDSYGKGAEWGALYGFAWWILGGLILMPLLLGMPALAPLMMGAMRPVAIGSLIGHVIYGLVLGDGYVWLAKSGSRQEQLRRPVARPVRWLGPSLILPLVPRSDDPLCVLNLNSSID